MGGRFQGTADFDAGAGVANLTANGSVDMFIAKYNASGDYIYAKNVGGIATLTYLNSIALDANNNIVATGFFSGTIDFDPGAGTANMISAGLDDIFIAKYDADGNYVFARQIGGTDYEQATAVSLDGSGNIYITGWFRSATVDFDPGAGVANITLAGSDDAFFAKYDANGTYVFAKPIANAGYEMGKNILVDAMGNINVIGEFNGTLDFDPGGGVASRTVGSYGIYIARYDANANFLFALGVGSGMRGNDLAVDASGNVYAVGMLNTTVDFDPGAGTANRSPAPGLQNTFIAGYNNTGDYRFAGVLGGYANTPLAEEGSAIARDAAGNIYVAGYFQGVVDFDPGPGTATLSASSTINSIYLAKYDANGNYIFAKSFFSTATAAVKQIMPDAAGNIYLVGNFNGSFDADPGPVTVYLTSSGSQDFFFAKYDASGNYIFAKQIGSTSVDQVNRATIDASGNLLLCGSFYGTVDFDPGAGTANLVATNNDGYFAKYDGNGNYIYAKKFTSSSYVSPQSISVDATGNVFLTGRLRGTGDFDPGAGTVNLVSAGSDDIFIARFDVNGNYVYAKRMGGTGLDQSYANAVDASGNTYITGGFNGTADFDPGAGTANLISGGGADIFIAKYDATGNYVFAKSFVGLGNGSDFAFNLLLDASSAVYVVGYFNATADFDGGPGTTNLVSAGGRDIFITKYDAGGNYVYAKAIGGVGSEFVSAIIKDEADNIFITGSFQYSTDLDPNAGTASHTSNNSYDIYFARYIECSSPAIASISTPSIESTINGTTAITDGGCALINTITPNGVNPISGTASAQVWIEPSVPSQVGQPFVARHYEITPSTDAATATGKITLYFTQQEFNDFNAHPGSFLDLPSNETDIAGKANLRIGKYPGNSNDGSGMPYSYTGTAEVIDPANTDIIWNAGLSRWEVSFDVTGFSGFILQTNATILPLRLLEFSGQLQNNNALLTWKTENENNSAVFEIERSIDGSNYASIGNVNATNTPAVHQYGFTDFNISSLGVSVVYYRLKQLDIDGKFVYSKIIVLSPENKNIVLLYPNPVINEMNLALTVLKSGPIQLSIIDNLGRRIKQQQLKLTAGANAVFVDVSNLPKGIYYLELKGININERKQFVK